MEKLQSGKIRMDGGSTTARPSRVGKARRPCRFGQQAFWCDWAPMILLGLVVSTLGVWLVATSVSADLSVPATMVRTQQAGAAAPITSAHEHDWAKKPVPAGPNT